MTIIHGTRKVRLFSTGPKSTQEVIRGYYLVLLNGDRYWIGETIYEAARVIEKACDKYLSAKDGYEYWIDYCHGYDVRGDLHWANRDFSNDVEAAGERLGL